MLHAVTFFQFIVSLIGLYRFLHPLAGITNHLQGCGVDIIETFDDVSNVIKDINSTKNNFDLKVGKLPSMPRIAKKQVNRDNTEGDSPEAYYGRVFAIPFTDKFISELELRFIKFYILPQGFYF